MLYFAYGSNMDWEQMRERCPSSVFVCRALLTDHCLAFTRTSRGTWAGCGVADVLPKKGAQTWGVVYQISDLEIATLDASEGYLSGRAKNAYCRHDIGVFREGNRDDSIVASIYTVYEKEKSAPPPHAEYLKRIISGAKQWDLPTEYIAQLLNIEDAP